MFYHIKIYAQLINTKFIDNILTHVISKEFTAIV